MKYRKKPVTVVARQWLGPESSPMPGVYVGVDVDDPASYYVLTVHGQKTPIAPGDWIIIEARQDRPGVLLAYPCKPDVFAATYEPAE